VCAAFLFSSLALADTVVTASGARISGTVRIKGQTVEIDTEDGTLSLSRSRVLSVISQGKTVARATPGGSNPGHAREAAAPEARAASVQAVLAKRISVRFDETPLADVLAYLTEITEANFVYNVADVQGANVLITMHLDDVTVRQVLDLALDNSNLGWTIVSEGIIRLGPRESVERIIVRTYDVRDLLVNVEDKRAMRTLTLTESQTEEDSGNASQWGGGSGDLSFYGESNGGRGGQLGSPSESLAERAYGVASLITSTVRPETWAQPAVMQLGGTTKREETDEPWPDQPW